MDTLTPARLAVQLSGSAEKDSRGRDPRQIREIARGLFLHEKWAQWHLTPEQVTKIKGRL